MNDIIALPEADVAAPALHFNDLLGRFEDAEGNPVEVTTEEVATVTAEGDTAGEATDVTVTTIH